jgi:protein-S-isoprenylcysteine O-methyltransferase
VEHSLRVAAVVGLGIFWAIDRACLQYQTDHATINVDRGSAKLWDLANALQVGAAFVAFTATGRMTGAVVSQVVGIACLLAGVWLRWYAMRTLGSLFTGRVTIRDGHRLIRTGPYALLRHPAYTGSLVAHVGLGLAFANWWSLAASTLPSFVAVLYRINVEERVLAESFGDAYRHHATATSRLIPWIY